MRSDPPCRPSPFPEQQEGVLGEHLPHAVQFLGANRQGSYLPPDVFFGLADQVGKIVLVDVADQDQIDDAGILAFGVIPHQVSFFQVAQPSDDGFQDAIHAQGFPDHGVQFGEQGVLPVGAVEDLPAVLFAGEKAGLVQLPQFLPDLAGRGVELFGKFAQIGVSFRVEKEAHQDVDAGF